MCKIAEELERAGIEKGREEGREEGIMRMIQDNLEMGVAKETVLEKVVRFFSVTRESALKCYDQVVME